MYGHFDPGPEPSYDDDLSQDTDVVMTLENPQDDEHPSSSEHVMDHDPVNNVTADRLVIAVDFGTTFSSVAYIVIPRGVPPEDIDVRNVKCIENYPGYKPAPGHSNLRQDVPTEIWYDTGLLDSMIPSDVNQGTNIGEEEYSSEDDDSSTGPRSVSSFDDDGGLEAQTSKKPKTSHVNLATQYWGYEVNRKLTTMSISREEARPLARFKLDLDQIDRGHGTEDIRTDFRASVRALKKKGVINSETDVYKHYLTHLLRHTKDQLLLSNELDEDMVFQFVLCVPAKWPVKACRVMQVALEDAVAEVRFSKSASTSVHNIFMISEPEAAAECILAEARSELFVRFPLLLFLKRFTH